MPNLVSYYQIVFEDGETSIQLIGLPTFILKHVTWESGYVWAIDNLVASSFRVPFCFNSIAAVWPSAAIDEYYYLLLSMQQPLAHQPIRPQSAQSVGQSDLLSSQFGGLQYQINPLNDGSFLIVDKTERNFVACLWMALAIALVVSLIVVGMTPPSYLKISETQNTCPNPVIINSDNSLGCADFNLQTNPKLGIVVAGLTKNHQHLIVNSHFYFNDTSNNTKVEQSVRLAQYRLRDENNTYKIQNMVIQERFDLQVDNYTRKSGFFTNESKLLGVKSYLLYQHEIAGQNLLIIVQFLNTSTPNLNLKNVTIEVLVVNPQFTLYQRDIRIAFMVKAILALIVFGIRLRKIPSYRRVVEHKFVQVLSILLIIYNNPLIAALIPSNNKFLIFILQTTYILLPVTLVLFWLCVFERGDLQNNVQASSVLRRPLTWALVSLLFIFELSLYLYKSYRHLVDYVGSQTEQVPLIGLKYTCFFIVLVCYAIIMIRIVNLFRKPDTMLRYRRLAAMSVIVVVLSLLFLLTVQHDVYSTEPKSMFLTLYYFNVYIYCLQFLYTKTHMILPLAPVTIESANMHPPVIAIHEVRKHPFFDDEQKLPEARRQKQEISANKPNNGNGLQSKWNTKLNQTSKANQQTNDQNIGYVKGVAARENKNNLDNFEIGDPYEKRQQGAGDIDEIGQIQELGQDLRLQDMPSGSNNFLRQGDNQ